MKRDSKFIAHLPDGYEYKMFECDGVIKIIGAHPEKKPIAWSVNDKLEWKEIEPDFTPEDKNGAE